MKTSSRMANAGVLISSGELVVSLVYEALLKQEQLLEGLNARAKTDITSVRSFGESWLYPAILAEALARPEVEFVRLDVQWRHERFDLVLGPDGRLVDAAVVAEIKGPARAELPSDLRHSLLADVAKLQELAPIAGAADLVAVGIAYGTPAELGDWEAREWRPMLAGLPRDWHEVVPSPELALSGGEVIKVFALERHASKN
jgi:hypothetical protein